MNSRERVQAALAHRTPDRIPVDFGSTAVTGIHVSCVAALRARYGLPEQPVKVIEPYQMLGEVADDLKSALGIDTDTLPGRNTLFGFPNEDWREFRLPWGQLALVPGRFQTSTDAGGDLLIYPEGDRLTFWGGGVDTQHTLPFGTPAEVREQVLRRCEIFGRDGGFVFNTIHNIQARTPVDNIAAMFEAVRELNG